MTQSHFSKNQIFGNWSKMLTMLNNQRITILIMKTLTDLTTRQVPQYKKWVKDRKRYFTKIGKKMPTKKMENYSM